MKQKERITGIRGKLEDATLLNLKAEKVLEPKNTCGHEKLK